MSRTLPPTSLIQTYTLGKGWRGVKNVPVTRFYVEETQWVMYEDMDTRHHWAMTDPVTTRSRFLKSIQTIITNLVSINYREDIERKFGDFTYNKGGSVLRMVSQVLVSFPTTPAPSTFLPRS